VLALCVKHLSRMALGGSGNNTSVVVRGSHEPLVVSRLCGEAGKQPVSGLRRLLQRVA